MTSADFPWEPPIAGTEQEHLFGALDRLRTTFRWKADGHTGHTDLLRESIDGRVGEDPPAGWRAEFGSYRVPGT